MRTIVKVKTHGDTPMPQVIKKGEWIDLYTTEKIEGNRLDSGLCSLGVSMRLPEDFEAIMVPRSSTFSKRGIMMTNSIGVIDNTFSGNDDVWKFPWIAMRDGVDVMSYTRVCQFRIQLSQKASLWSKLKWLLSDGIELVKVDDLDDESRGGFGSTGEQ